LTGIRAIPGWKVGQMRLKAVEVKFPILTRRSITGLMILAMVLSVLGTTGWRGYTMGGASNYVRSVVGALGQ